VQVATRWGRMEVRSREGDFCFEILGAADFFFSGTGPGTGAEVIGARQALTSADADADIFVHQY
jgi:hypothetical protein